MGLTTRDVGRTREELVNHEPGEVFPFLVFPFPISGFPLPGFPVPDFFSSSFPVPEFPAPAFPVQLLNIALISEHEHIFWVISFPLINIVRTGFFWSVDVILN